MILLLIIQVAAGLSYMHEHDVVYYDLKSPNILVFKFPSAQESLQATAGALEEDQTAPQQCTGSSL